MQFFSNAVDANAFGPDRVADFSTDVSDAGRFQLIGASNLTPTDVNRVQGAAVDG